MKFTINLLLTIAIFCTVTLAGDQGNGGATGCTINCPPPPPCTVNCDGLAGNPGVDGLQSIETDLMVIVIEQMLGANL